MQIIVILFLVFGSLAHELHLSMCSITYNEDASRIELEQRIFYDDLEKSLQYQLNDDRFDILKPQESDLNYDSLFQDYMNKHIKFFVNDRSVELELLEYEVDNETVVLYMYKTKIKKLKSINFLSHILFEIYQDQDNIISIQANGQKKSQKFDVNSKALQIEYQ